MDKKSSVEKSEGKMVFQTLDLDGATCSGCVRTLEHVGPKLPGVKELTVDRAKAQINLEYQEGTSAVDEVVKLVSRLGYTATPVIPSPQ